MRLLRVFLTLAFFVQVGANANAQLSDGECTITLDPSVFDVGDIDLLEDPEFAIAAPLMDVSPVADGTLAAGEYSNQCFFTYAENENPGQSHPNYDNLQDGDPDLTVTMHFAHTGDSLFVAFDVTDDFLDLDFPANSFNNDGVELFLNPDNDSGDAWGLGKMQLYVDAAGDGELLDNNRGHAAGILAVIDPGPEEGEFYSAGLVKDDESGYIVEFEIPLASLDTTGGDDDYTPMETGDFMMINAAIDDNDEDDNLDGQTGHHLLWHVDGAGSPFQEGEGIWNVPLLLSEPAVAGPDGDYDGDGEIGPGDLDVHAQYVKDNDPKGDLDANGVTDLDDRIAWTRDIQNSYIGDSNFDGQFDSSDFVAVFGAAKYETGSMAGYAEGDWNGDMVFDSSDFVTAFSDGGYEKGPRAAGVAAVPEPATASLMFIGLIALLGFRKRS